MIKEIDGNILDCDSQYIAHQCNCKSVGQAAGLAESIFNKYPETNIYKENIDRKTGEIIVIGKVINMLSQCYPGKPSSWGDIDNRDARLRYFRECLDRISKIDGIKSLAFPYKIGCGLAGGDWVEYKKEIENFSEENKSIEVSIVKL